jgi:glycosyltransferase involved in cell wall biosynthesis
MNNRKRTPVRERDRKVLFVTMGFSSFIQNDIEILQKRCSVRIFHYPPSKKLVPNLWRQLRLVFWLCFRMPCAEAVFVWFADYHAFLPVLFSRLSGRKSIVFMAGYDATRIPELNYGVFSNPVRSACARFAIGHADVVAPVATALIAKARSHVPNIRGRIVRVPFGFDAAEWFCDTPKENLVLTVGIADDETRIRIKGLDLFVKAAGLLPQYRFVAVGVGDRARGLLNAPPNVQFLGRVPHSELRGHYSRAKVYAQLSLSEGMPNAACEAMLCECVPVGTKAGGIPETIGGAGFVLKRRDVEEAVRMIKKAMNLPSVMGQNARNRIINLYSVRNRYVALFSLLQQRKIWFEKNNETKETYRSAVLG